MPMKIDTCCVIKSVAKVTPKMSPRYLLRSPVSIRSAIQVMVVPSSATPARDDERFAGDPRCPRGSQEANRRGDVLRLTDAAERRLRFRLPLEVARDNPGGMSPFGLDHARIDGIDTDLARSQLLGK